MKNNNSTNKTACDLEKNPDTAKQKKLNQQK